MPTRSELNKHYLRAIIILVHLVLWGLSLFGAFVLRFEFDVPSAYQRLALAALPLLLAVRTATFFYFGLFHGLWRYTGSRDLVSLFKASTSSTLLFVLLIYALGITGFPRSIYVIEFLGCVMLVGGLRFSVRKLREITNAIEEPGKRRNLLIIGAGDAGEMLLRDLLKTWPNRYHIVGFADDDTRKVGARIHDVPVLGSIAQVPDLVRGHAVNELIIAIPTATGREMRRIVQICEQVSCAMRTIPGLDSLIDGRVTVNQLRDVAIEDLLGRDPVALDSAAISAFLSGKVVMVTGAGGSIGSELCRQVCRFRPAGLILVERAENALFEIHRELKRRWPDVPVFPAIADITDRERMAGLIARTAPHVIFHAAAHKHVPMMEANPREALKNNVGGTRLLADLAHTHGVPYFVMVSTDKAVNPTSVMGVSKRVAELYIQALAGSSSTRFITVRFGNVLGSAGSVVPIFREQIARGGPVTVTHADMKRYFMTIPEACELIMQAGTMGRGGEIFVLDMGEPVRILDLAHDLIRLSGLTPGDDIEVEITGMRPGEKLYEELNLDSESADKTRHPRIFIGRSQPRDVAELAAQLDRLLEVTAGADPARVRAELRRVVPEYTPGEAPSFDIDVVAPPAATSNVVPLRR